MANATRYFFFAILIHSIASAVIERKPPTQSLKNMKNLLTSRNCWFSPSQCVLPKVFNKYVPAENTSSILGKKIHKHRLHRMVTFLKNSRQSKVYY